MLVARGSVRKADRLFVTRSGFTLIELLVVVAIILLLVVVGYPNFVAWIAKSRIMGVVQSTSVRLQAARQEAIKTNNFVVAQPDFDSDQIIYFVNVDRDTGFQFSPDPSATHRTADFELGRQMLPTGFQIEFWAAKDQRAEGNGAVDGLTPTSAAVNAVVFRPDGSVVDPGAIRFADDRGNFLEVRFRTPSSTTAEVRKYHPNPPWGGQDDYFPRGRNTATGDPLWLWY